MAGNDHHDNHGQSVAAWTGVGILMVAAVVMSWAVVISPSGPGSASSPAKSWRWQVSASRSRVATRSTAASPDPFGPVDLGHLARW